MDKQLIADLIAKGHDSVHYINGKNILGHVNWSLTNRSSVLKLAQMASGNLKPVLWVGASHDDLRRLADAVQDEIGYALYFAQQGQRHESTKVLKGFGGAGVLEIIENDVGGTYRAVYTVKFAGVIYVLHVFQKKSKSGIATPKNEIDLIRRRLSVAEAHYREHKHEFQRTEKIDEE